MASGQKQALEEQQEGAERCQEDWAAIAAEAVVVETAAAQPEEEVTHAFGPANLGSTKSSLVASFAQVCSLHSLP